MKTYRVVRHYFTADSPEAAAREALRIQRDPASCATVFKVWDEGGIDTTVDITALDEATP